MNDSRNIEQQLLNLSPYKGKNLFFFSSLIHTLLE